MKDKTKEFFLFRHRFIIGYILIMLIFVALLFILPSIAPEGLSHNEMSSAVTSDNLHLDFMKQGNVVNLPYYALQKLSIKVFGLTLYAIKIPSIVFGAFSALFLTLLLNRWFKSDVAIIGSALATLSTAFLSLANFGTPDILYIFWISLILWLGSKIVGNKNIHPFFVILFTSSIALSLYTPHLCYIALAILIAGIAHPHLRYSIKVLKPWQLILAILIFAVGLAPLGISVFYHHNIIQELAFMENFSQGAYIQNLKNAFAPYFSFTLAYDSVHLAPLFGLATVALIAIGFISSLDKLFASRNSVTYMLVAFAVIISGLNVTCAAIIIVPVAIMCSAAIDSMIMRWKSIFPKNPYAHLIGATPIVITLAIMLISGLAHYIQGYHYTPRVTKNFSEDLALFTKELKAGDTLILNTEDENHDFYKLFAKKNNINVNYEFPKNSEGRVAVIEAPVEAKGYELSHISTSSKSRNSDRLYIYTKVTDKQETGE